MSLSQPDTNYNQRLKKLATALQQHKLNALVLNPGPSLPYFTGLSFHMSERPVIVFFGIDQDPIIVLPELEAPKINNLSYEIQAFTYGENPNSWEKAFKAAIKTGKYKKSTI